jgi:hypothetical protein
MVNHALQRKSHLIGINATILDKEPLQLKGVSHMQNTDSFT